MQQSLFILLLYRLLYSPVSILEEINAKLETDDSKNYLYLILKAQLTISFLISLFIVAFFLIISVFLSLSFLNLLLFYFGGAIIGSLAITFGTYGYFYSSNKKPNEKQTQTISLSLTRASTRLWIFFVGVGLAGMLFYVSLERNNIDNIHLYIVIMAGGLIDMGVLMHKAYQLMTVAGSIDRMGFDNKYNVLFAMRNTRYQRAGIIMIMISVLVVGASVIFLMMTFDLEGNICAISQLGGYLIGIFFLLSGWLLGLHSLKGMGERLIRLIAFLTKVKKLDWQEMQSYDEISNRPIVHVRNLESLQANPKLFIKIVDKYYAQTPYRNEALNSLVSFLSNVGFEDGLRTYLAHSDEMVALDGLIDEVLRVGIVTKEISSLKNLRLRQYLFGIRQFTIGVSEGDAIDRLKRLKDDTLPFLVELQSLVNKIQPNEKYGTVINDFRRTFISKYRFLPDKAFKRYVHSFFIQLEVYFENRFQDTLSYELDIILQQRSVTISRSGTFLDLQFVNSSNEYISIEEVNVVFGSNLVRQKKEIKIDQQIPPNYFTQSFVEVEATKPLLTKLDVEVKFVKGNEVKFKQISFDISFKLLQSFGKTENRFGLKPVKIPQFFIGRDKELSSMCDQIESGGSRLITLMALRRIGKTSLLFQLKYKLKGFDVKYLDAHELIEVINKNEGETLINNTTYLFDLILNAISNQSSNGNDSTSFYRAIGKGKKVIILDEFDVVYEYAKPGIISEWLKLLRNTNIDNNLFFIFALPYGKMFNWDIEARSVLGECTYYLKPFNKMEAHQLITGNLSDPLHFTPQAIKAIYRTCGGFPSLLNAFLFQLINFNNKVTQAAEINIEVVNSFDHSRTFSLEAQVMTILSGFPDELYRGLLVFKKYDNRLPIKDFNEICMAMFPQLDAASIKKKLIEWNFIEQDENFYICSSNEVINHIKHIQ